MMTILLCVRIFFHKTIIKMWIWGDKAKKARNRNALAIYRQKKSDIEALRAELRMLNNHHLYAAKVRSYQFNDTNRNKLRSHPNPIETLLQSLEERGNNNPTLARTYRWLVNKKLEGLWNPDL